MEYLAQIADNEFRAKYQVNQGSQGAQGSRGRNSVPYSNSFIADD